MTVLDTSVLSLAFRRRRRGRPESPAAALLRKLILEDKPLLVPGIVLQELLSGLQSEEQFKRLEELTRGFRILPARREHHVAAARIANRCRGRGIAASTIDCLIAAQTIAGGARLLTLDDDFARLAPLCGLKLVAIAA